MTTTDTYHIRRAVVLPLGLLVALMYALLAVCIMQQQPMGKIVLLFGLSLPPVVFLVENAMRRLVIDAEGLTAFRPFRQRQINFAEVTSLESVSVRNRVLITLAVGDDNFLIISNTYADFPRLVNALIAAVPEEAVTEEAQQLAAAPAGRAPGVAPIWFAVVALVYILMAQFSA
ncbi:MAG: hypothetical protein OET90_03575 [Desulfuromonadales bacterium]|nr:hypothetical protein [Desulfuromonadales bacterium]